MGIIGLYRVLGIMEKGKSYSIIEFRVIVSLK